MNKKYKVELIRDCEVWCQIRITFPSGKQRTESFERELRGWHDGGWCYMPEFNAGEFSRFIAMCDKWDYNWKRKFAEVYRKGAIELDPDHVGKIEDA